MTNARPWSESLAPHISLTVAQVRQLERVRHDAGLPDDFFRLYVEQWPPFRQAWFDIVQRNVVAMTPDMRDIYYAACVAYEFFMMRRATYDFLRAAEAARSDGDPLPPLRVLRAPSQPTPPSPEELGEMLDLMRELDTRSVTAFVQHIMRAESDERAAESEPRLRAMTDAIFAIVHGGSGTADGPVTVPHWCTGLSAHIRLTPAKVAALESLRERQRVDENSVRLILEEYPAFRRAYFRRAYQAVAAMSPGADEMFYATRVLGVFHDMNVTVERYGVARQSNASAVLPSLDVPAQPPWPTNVMWTSIQHITAQHGWRTMQEVVEGCVQDEAATRAGLADPALVAFITAAFTILDTESVEDAWPEWR